ncbi:uncharacterized protein [Littorina saxatilis]|uniref:uncharacterized protein n=1 Tax=Littorina saxatilis TaxID=31220 RepID=UPI0038B6305A
MESPVGTNENPPARDFSVRRFQTIGATEKELVSAMMEATCTSDHELLHRLIANTPSGRRVFKQLCLKSKIPFVVSRDLQARKDLDLAFNVVVGNRLWNYVLELYHHPDVTQRSRRQALQRAIREGAWSAVTQIILYGVTSRHDRRQAFLAAVRQNELAWAWHLCEHGIDVLIGDLKFAIQSLLAAGQVQYCNLFLQLYQGDPRGHKLFKLVLSEIVHAGSVVATKRQQPHIEFHAINGILAEFTTSVSEREDSVLPENSTEARTLPITSSKAAASNVHVLLPPSDPTNAETAQSVQRLQMFIIRQAVDSSNADCFRSLCFEVADNERLLQYAFMEALKAEKLDMITKTIVCQDQNFQHRRMLRLAVKLGMKSKKFDFIKQVVDDHKECLSWTSFFVCETEYVKGSKNWSFIIPLLESLVNQEQGFHVFDAMTWTFTSQKIKLLAKWCTDNDCSTLAFCFALEIGQWRLARRNLDTMADPMTALLFDFAFDKALSGKAWRVATACLKRAPADTELDADMFWDSNGESETLIQHCRMQGLAQWAIKVGVCTENWQIVEAEMESCDDESIFNLVLREAARCDRWEFVSKLLDRCTGSEQCLFEVLTETVENGNCACAKKLLNLINPLADESGHRSLLFAAVESKNEEMIDLCIQAGLSTLQQPNALFWSPAVVRAVTGYLPRVANVSLVKALFESGASSYDDLKYLTAAHMFSSLGLQSPAIPEILMFVKETSTTPRSLQSLCRLSVSHLIGCRPGREKRILALPVPQCIKDFLMFKDLTLTTDEQVSSSAMGQQ